jgi:asparagine synthetase B (glutamine-hydrolysing)
VFNRTVPSRIYGLNAYSSSVTALEKHLYDSLKLRILNVPKPPNLDDVQNVRIAILFSGGLDCTVLARMAHDLLPSDQHIDLINVAFENPRVVQAAKRTSNLKNWAPKPLKPNYEVGKEDEIIYPRNTVEKSSYERCPDRETGRKSFQELQDVCPGRIWRFVTV